MGNNAEGTLGFRRPRSLGRSYRAIAVVLAIVAAGSVVGYLLIRPDLPGQSDLQAVSQLVGDRKVIALDLSGSTLTVTLRDGSRLRVENVTVAQAEPVQEAAVATGDVSVSYSGTSPQQTAIVALSSLLPVAIVVLGMLWLLSLFRARPSGGAFA